MSNSYDRLSTIPHLKLFRCTQLPSPFLDTIRSLWNSEYPKSLNYPGTEHLEDYLTSLEDQRHTLLIAKSGQVMAWYFDFIRDDERWFAMILDASIHGKGYGSDLLNLAKQDNRILHGWVIDHDQALKANGELYSSPLQFYVKNGFEVNPESRLELEKISAVQISWELSPSIL